MDQGARDLGPHAGLVDPAGDGGPRLEAARASGANRLLTVRWAVLPQVLPNYVAYSLYAFELNIRASAVLGIVGAAADDEVAA